MGRIRASPASGAAETGEGRLEEPAGIALDPAGTGHRRRRGCQSGGHLDVTEVERLAVAAVEDLQHAHDPGVVDERDGQEGARQVARSLRRCPAEPRVGGHVRDRESLSVE